MTDGSIETLAGQRVLVTGGVGVIARELLGRLSAAGAQVAEHVLGVVQLRALEPARRGCRVRRGDRRS